MTTFECKRGAETSFCDFPGAVNTSTAIISDIDTAHYSSANVGAADKNKCVPAAVLTACRSALVKSPAASRAALQKYRASIDVDPALARLLETVGAYSQANDGSTPLYEAVKRGDATTTQLLIALGAERKSELGSPNCVNILSLATNISCRSLLEEHSIIFPELVQDPALLVSAAAAHIASLSASGEPLPATSMSSLRAYHLEPSFLWAPSEARDKVFAWARNMFIVQLASNTESFTDLPDDCAGDVLKYFETSIPRAESLHNAARCLSPEAHAWMRAVLGAAVATDASFRLLTAVEENNLAMVQDCIEKGADANVQVSLPSCLVALIQEANLDDLPLGHTALIIASCKGHTAIVKLLLEAGADTNILSPMRRYTALMTATEQGHTAIVKLLLEAGADVNVLSPMRHYSALMTAAELGHTAIVKLLEEAGSEAGAGDLE